MVTHHVQRKEKRKEEKNKEKTKKLQRTSEGGDDNGWTQMAERKT